VPIGTFGPAIHAALAVVVLSLLQVMGTGASGRVQVALTALTIVLILVLAAAGFVAEPGPVELSQNVDQSSGLAGLALVFILLTYGGWNEASYLSGEIKDVRRKMVLVLLMGTGIVVALYMVFNFSLAYSLGVERLAKQTTVTGPIEVLFGSWGSAVAGMAICIAALSTLNGTLFTGGRSVYALGQSFAPLKVLGKTNSELGTPAAAIASQSVISLSLIGFGALQRDGFTAMVEYTAPVFWGFMLLAGFSLFLFRWREPNADRPFRVPFYPITPLLFCATSAYLLHASLAYTGAGALIGVAVLLLGIPIYWLSDNRQAAKPVTSSARTPARR
jgi:amino acid transporter